MADMKSSTTPAVAAPQSSSAKRLRELLDDVELIGDVPEEVARKVYILPPKKRRVSSSNMAVKWTEEMHNLMMTLAGEQKGERWTVSGAAWKQIALDMSAKDWPSAGGSTYTLLFTKEACQHRYSKHKGVAFIGGAAFVAPTTAKWTAETNAYFMGLVEERKKENGSVSGDSWKQIAEMMSAKEWETSQRGTYTMSFTKVACRMRYNHHKGAFEESAGAKVVWTVEMHNLVEKLAGERMGGKYGTVTRAAWKQIAEIMSAKEWETSEGGTQKLSFTAKACQTRYNDYKGAYTIADNMHSIPTTSSY